jgi:hypothetical protein
MALGDLGSEARQALEHVLGYLNFSSGTPDPTILSQLDRLFCQAGSSASGEPACAIVGRWLRDGLQQLATQSPTFQNADQAQHVLRLTWEHLLPGYRAFHRDLLFHQTDETLFRPFLVGRMFEAVLKQGPPWNEEERITRAAIAQLNDFIGHRPVAVLETQKREPYAHEWVRPIPVYIRGAGVSVGPWQRMIELTLRILEGAPEDILRQAQFDPECLDELAIDPRAYDFDHPVNKRPNYHFGQWDPHNIDLQGRYRRFVLQEVTLNALLHRVQNTPRRPRKELEFESAVVLAGTILMASGVSGRGPNAFDSTTQLAELLRKIAAYRDAFYEHMIAQMPDEHGQKLRREAARRKQPFGGARQHLNAELARRRAAQLEHVHLARVFAAIGYPESAAEQASVVPVASARMLCQIDCLLTEGMRKLQRGDIAAAADLLPGIFDLVQRGIECGALIDPWNILGFDAHFSLFFAGDNSIYDHRVDDLLKLIDRIFGFHANVWAEAAAKNETHVCQQVQSRFRATTEWWRQFAAHECSSVKCADPQDVFEAARLVAAALGMWHQGGAAAGDIAFWARHASMFPSPEAYGLVIQALLDRGDFVASMALLMHWLSQTPRIPLVQSDASFLRLATAWLSDLAEQAAPATVTGGPATAVERAEQRWQAAQKFFDFLEANAEEYWTAPTFLLGAARSTETAAASAEDGDDEDIFSAAYEDVVYQDKTDDGIDSSLSEAAGDNEDEFDLEARRLIDRLAFLRCVSRLWKVAAIHAGLAVPPGPLEQQKVDMLRRWHAQAAENRKGLIALLESVRGFRLPATSADQESLAEYDRRRMAKDALLEQIIYACVDTVDAARFVEAAAFDPAAVLAQPSAQDINGDDEREAVAVMSALIRRDHATVCRRWKQLEAAFRSKSLLYVPVTKGGDPRLIVAARVRKRTIQDLLVWLPRAGLLLEGCRLIEMARHMDRINTVGPGAVTEYDELFSLGYKALVETILVSFPHWDLGQPQTGKRARQRELVSCLERLTESMLMSWLAHSQTLRLSVLEYLYDEHAWKDLVSFIDRYGHDLFTQRFLSFTNLRAILHQGVAVWLEQLQQQAHVELKLLDELDTCVSRESATRQLTLVLDAIVENYVEYRDYNSTTTQSDRGEMLYVLLDFLRLQSRYERICWNLRPVVLAHELLVRRGFAEVGRSWRRELSDRIREKANEFVSELRRLQRRYSILMPTVADRIQERFVQPLAIDRIRALVEPAMREARENLERRAIELLERDTEMLTRQPSGAGLDLPTWLEVLEEEVERLHRPMHARDDDETLQHMIPQTIISHAQTLDQIEAWANELAQSSDAPQFRWSD